MNSNSGIFTPAFCYGAAILAAFVTALSQIILKRQANITEAKKSGFFSKFLNPRVIISYGLLFSTLVINQVALIHVPVSVMPCITATSFVWVFIMGVLILKEKVSRRRSSRRRCQGAGPSELPLSSSGSSYPDCKII